LGWPMRIVHQPLWGLVRTLIGPAVAVGGMILAVVGVGRLAADWGQVTRLALEVATGVVVYPILLRVFSPSATQEIVGIIRRRGR
jgi:K+ transporter